MKVLKELVFFLYIEENPVSSLYKLKLLAFRISVNFPYKLFAIFIDYP